VKTVAEVRVATRAAGLGVNIPISNPPIRQAQRPAATQKITSSFLRLLSGFAATVLVGML
jgi:hypothetical protein